MVTAAVLGRVLSGVVDPEIPVLSIADLGILRDATIGHDGAVTVTITPTYSGCPAMGVIEEDIRTALAEAGFDEVTVRTTFSPAWTTDWLSEDARRRLADYGIAPPGAADAPSTPVLCPRCAASETRLVAEFGSTACKALRVCERCGEPFDHFKAI
jgi:ring-1,2-phenylacetyl-CoA epoxidase subunit PaaD